jgi:hypothetical protein
MISRILTLVFTDLVDSTVRGTRVNDEEPLSSEGLGSSSPGSIPAACTKFPSGFGVLQDRSCPWR